MAKYVIYPATLPDRCSVVELMASGEQPPDFFVSHYWAEPILEFFKCLLEHSWARGLEEEDVQNRNDQNPWPVLPNRYDLPT